MEEEGKRLRAEVDKLRDELSKAQADAKITKEQLAKAQDGLSKLNPPSEEEVRQGLDQQQTRVRQMIGEKYPGYRIDRLYYDRLEMPNFEQPIQARFVFNATGPDGQQQAGELPVSCDFTGRCEFGELALLDASGTHSVAGDAATAGGEAAGGTGKGSLKPPILEDEPEKGESTTEAKEVTKKVPVHGMPAEKEYDLTEKMKGEPLKLNGAGAPVEDAE